MSERYETEEVLWEPSTEFGPRRARVPVRITAYVPKPLQTLRWDFSSSVTAALGDAQSAVAQTQAHAAQIGLSTIAKRLLRSESMASSQIEGLGVPSHRSLAKADVGKRHREGARAALANIDAVEWLYRWARGSDRFEPATLRATHERIAQSDRWLSQHAGIIRTGQNWIGKDPHTPAGADFVPPPPAKLPQLLDDLCGFLNRVDLPPVAQAAIAHVQFETLHPFPDGNGRVGRALIGACLVRAGVCEDVVPPISLVLARDKQRYLDALTSFRFDSAEPWLLLLAESTELAAHASLQLADDIAALQERWRDAAGRPRRDSAAERIIQLLPAEPMLNAERAATLTGASSVAVRGALTRLEDAGVLGLVTVGRRNRVWECHGLFALIDELERTLSGGAIGATANTGGAD